MVTYFSPASLNAAKYAADMAVAINADLQLSHVYPVPISYTETQVADNLEDMQQGFQEDYRTQIAVTMKTQVWIAVSIYVLVAIAKKNFMLKQNLYEILQILSISIFERVPLNQLFQQTQLQYFKEQKDNQLNMFDL